jgi:hypothetical protein
MGHDDPGTHAMTLQKGAWRAPVLLAAICLCALPAAAQTYNPLQPADVQRALEASSMTGIKIDKSEDAGEGDYVNAIYKGVNFWVHFTACDDDHTNCEVIVFDASFGYNENSTRPTLEEINDWNEYNLGKAGIADHGNPWINIEVNTVGGITRENLDDTIAWWKRMLEDFAGATNWTWPS